MRTARVAGAFFVLSSMAPSVSPEPVQPVIDMHMHAYSGELRIPNPNTGELLAPNGDEHRTACLQVMREHNVGVTFAIEKVLGIKV